nr:MAG TPA: YopX protein [Caudoviricetes sp.]
MKTKYRYWNPGPQTMVEVITINFMDPEVTFSTGQFWQTLPLREEYLMQSTGLFDKNGTEIFEGDIIKMRFPRDRRFIGKFKVIKDPVSTGIALLDENLTNEGFNLYNYMPDYYEVVGNVFEGER